MKTFIALLLAFASSLVAAQPKQPDLPINLVPRERAQPTPLPVPQPVNMDVGKALDGGVITFSLNGKVNEFTGSWREPQKDGIQVWVSNRSDAGRLVFVRRTDGSVAGMLQVGPTPFAYSGRGAAGQLVELPKIYDQGGEAHERMHRPPTKELLPQSR